MARAEVLSVREFRAGLAEAIKHVVETGPVFVGAHRRAEAVLMSVEEYDELVAARHAARAAPMPRWVAVQEAVASVRAEGLEPGPEGVERLRAVAQGLMSPEEAIDRALAPYSRGD